MDNKNQVLNDLEKRYKKEIEVDWEGLKKEFWKNVYFFYDISIKNPLLEVFLAGISTYP